MKKTFRLMALVAMTAGLAFSSCDRDEPVNPIPDNPTPVNPVDPDPEDPTAEWVDLGLPSGLLWATCNLGASSPEGYGDYYAWGETETKSYYDWSNYRYCNGSEDQLTKYCTNPDYGYNGFTDDLTTLQDMDDAATHALGNGTRTPTMAEWDELEDNTTSTWTTMNGVKGRKFIAANGKSLFLPAAGDRSDGEFNNAGLYGPYWSSSLLSYAPLAACYFSITPDGQSMGGRSRCIGFSVRAVRQN